jgi:hypothetical protein
MLKSGLVAACSAVAVVGIGAMVGVPMAYDWFEGRHEQESSYATGKAAKADRASMPAWLPDNATQVRYKMKTNGGDRLLVARLAGGKLPQACAPFPHRAHGVDRERPGLTASWFPKGVAHRVQVRCGLYYGFADRDTFYAWQQDRDWEHAPAAAR